MHHGGRRLKRSRRYLGQAGEWQIIHEVKQKKITAIFFHLQPPQARYNQR